jgi:hypothetical protein
MILIQIILILKEFTNLEFVNINGITYTLISKNILKYAIHIKEIKFLDINYTGDFILSLY